MSHNPHAVYLADCGRTDCRGNGFRTDPNRDEHGQAAAVIECTACGPYATIRQIQFLVSRGYVVYLNLATTRYEIQRRIGPGTDDHIDSYGSVLDAIADLVLGVDLSPNDPGESERRSDLEASDPASASDAPATPTGSAASTSPEPFDLGTAIAAGRLINRARRS